MSKILVVYKSDELYDALRIYILVKDEQKQEYCFKSLDRYNSYITISGFDSQEEAITAIEKINNRENSEHEYILRYFDDAKELANFILGKGFKVVGV